MGALTLITSHLTTSFRRLCAVHKQPTPLGWYCNAIRINVMFKLCSTFSAVYYRVVTSPGCSNTCCSNR